MSQRRGAPAGSEGLGLFEATSGDSSGAAEEYFIHLAARLREAETTGWSPEHPGRPLVEGGKYTWSLTASTEALPLARHAAPTDDGAAPASTEVLAARSAGLQTWGVLRGDVDNFGIRIRRAQSIEEHIQLSVLHKQFFAGELEVICSMPEFWRKVTVIYAGGDDFAVYGAWDALLALGAEMERLFHRFAEQNLKDFPGLEGKTISMALALAPAEDASLGAVFEEAGRRLEAAKSSDKDCIWLLGRTLEWKQFEESAGLKDSLMRMIVGVRLLSAVSEGPVRHLSRDAIASVAAPGAAHRRREAVALPSSYPANFGRGAAGGSAARGVSKSADGADRGPDRAQCCYSQVAPGGARSARMGQIVR